MVGAGGPRTPQKVRAFIIELHRIYVSSTFQSFRGETPKRDIMSYCKKQVDMLRTVDDNTGKVLLWDLLYLLCKQNGVSFISTVLIGAIIFVS